MGFDDTSKGKGTWLANDGSSFPWKWVLKRPREDTGFMTLESGW